MDIQEELNKMKLIIKEKNKYPVFFIGAGLSRRYLIHPIGKNYLLRFQNK